MANKICPVCGVKGKCKVKVANNETICSNCTKLSSNHSAETVETLKSYLKEQLQRKVIFNKTREIKDLLSSVITVDENNKLFYLGNKKTVNPIFYRFEEITSYEFENFPSKVVTKKKGGLGRAVVGGALLGGVGAVVGASTAKSVTVEKKGAQYLKVYLNTYAGETVLTIYDPPLNADKFFNVCISNSARTETTNADNVDEILKYKKLLDEGIITTEQFENKKKELLNL